MANEIKKYIYTQYGSHVENFKKMLSVYTIKLFIKTMTGEVYLPQVFEQGEGHSLWASVETKNEAFPNKNKRDLRS